MERIDALVIVMRPFRPYFEQRTFNGQICSLSKALGFRVSKSVADISPLCFCCKQHKRARGSRTQRERERDKRQIKREREREQTNACT
jgi:hypothetical protein